MHLLHALLGQDKVCGLTQKPQAQPLPLGAMVGEAALADWGVWTLRI